MNHYKQLLVYLYLAFNDLNAKFVFNVGSMISIIKTLVFSLELLDLKDKLNSRMPGQIQMFPNLNTRFHNDFLGKEFGPAFVFLILSAWSF